MASFFRPSAQSDTSRLFSRSISTYSQIHQVAGEKQSSRNYTSFNLSVQLNDEPQYTTRGSPAHWLSWTSMLDLQ